MLDDVGQVLAQSAARAGRAHGVRAWAASSRGTPRLCLGVLLPARPIAKWCCWRLPSPSGATAPRTSVRGVVDEWERSGTLEVFHYGDNEPRQLHYEFYRDALAYPAAHVQVQVPTLIFQGLQDEVVKPQGVIEILPGASECLAPVAAGRP